MVDGICSKPDRFELHASPQTVGQCLQYVDVTLERGRVVGLRTQFRSHIGVLDDATKASLVSMLGALPQTQLLWSRQTINTFSKCPESRKKRYLSMPV